MCLAFYKIENDEYNFVPILNELLCPTEEIPKLTGDYSVICVTMG